MATTIVTKYGSDAPAASDIVRGELAVDTENGRLYTENSSGAVVEIGLNPEGNVDVTGTVTTDGLTSAGDAAITGGSSGSTVLTLTSNALADTPLMVFQRTGGAVAGKLAYEDTNTAMSFGTTTGHELKLLANNTRAIQVDSGGDINFYEDTGTTAKFFWDASAEALGIGTASPDTQLTLFKASTNADVNYAKMRMDSWGSSQGKLKSIAWDDSGNPVAAIGAEYDGNKTNIHFHSQYNGGFKGTSDRTMSIMGNGNVTIPASGADASRTLSIQGTNGSSQTYQFNIVADGENSAAKFMVGSGGGAASEVMRISGGNLLVGTTNTLPANNNVEGIALSAGSYGGRLEASRSGGSPCSFNRVDSDGSIIELRKAGSPVGSIGSVSGTDIELNSTLSGSLSAGGTKRFGWNTSGVFFPHTDNANDLGASGSRFKDLYLSGTASMTGLEPGIVTIGSGSYFKGNATNGYRFNNAADTSNLMILKDDGNLLLGTTTAPSLAGLAVGSTGLGKNINVFSSANGSNGIIAVHQSNGTQEGQLYAGTGDINLFGTSVVKIVASSGGVKLTSGSSSWVANSDERAKDIIEPISNAAQKVSTLRAVIGKYKTDTEETRRSFLIAQDVQAVLPEAVDATDEDNLGVRYTETIPLLVAAIQEQQATIEALTARIAALES